MFECRKAFEAIALGACIALLFIQPVVAQGQSADLQKALAAAMQFEFPLAALAPTVEGKDLAGNGDVVFAQPLRPAAAIRTKVDFSVRFPAMMRDPIDLTIPAQTIFVKAVVLGDEFYCTSRVAYPAGWRGWADAGLCLVDTQNDGVFNSLYTITQRNWRIRSPYELIRRELRQPASVNVAYEKLPPEQIPVLELRGRFHNDGSLFSGGTETISLGLCWPPELTISDPDTNYYSASCALTDWPASHRPRNDEDIVAGRHSISLKEGRKDLLTWGPVSIAVTGREKNLISAHVEAFMPPGPVTSTAQKVYSMGFDPAHEIYVLHLKSASEAKAEASKGGI